MEVNTRNREIELALSRRQNGAVQPSFGEAPRDGREKWMSGDGKREHREIESFRIKQQVTHGPRLTPHIPPARSLGTLQQVYAVVYGRIVGVVLDTPAAKRRIVGMYAAGARGGVSFVACPAKVIARGLSRPKSGKLVPVPSEKWESLNVA
jgi:hypothetical protein